MTITCPDEYPTPTNPDTASRPDAPTDGCGWAALSWSEYENRLSAFQPGFAPGDGYDYFSEGGRAARKPKDGGEIELGVISVGCDTAGRIDFSVAAEPDPVVVAASLVEREIPVPVPDVSPAPEFGSVVNLGLWLAVADRDPISLSHSGRGITVTVTATLASTRWDMGDGVVVECSGGGVPITDVDVVEEGPCGHTYAAPTPDDEPHQVTVTTTWTVSWVATDGRSGTPNPIVRSATFAYDVDEITTVGVSN